MKPNEVRQLLQARPFHPFYIHVADGGRLLVKHEDYVAVAPSGRTMLVYRHNKPDEYEMLDLVMVTRLEVLVNRTRKKQRAS